MRTLYLDCASGIAGDMTVAALLDLGANQAGLEKLIADMNLGCTLHFTRVDKNGLDAMDFDVELPHGHKHAHETTKEDLEHQEHHHHETRNLAQVTEIIMSSGLTKGAKEQALKVFRIVAEAEAKVHEKPLEEVHFHEVGAIDSIVDICGVAYCLDDLQIDRIIASPLSEGVGTILCQHGELSVPVPATKEICNAHHVPMIITDNQGEMVTPTGAAIVAALAQDYQELSKRQGDKVGYGAGKRVFKGPNVLRAIFVEE